MSATIRGLIRAHWFDGGAVYRVQDNYVVQWGQGDDDKKPPQGLDAALPAEYDRPAAGLPIVRLPYRDAYAPKVGFSGAFPVAVDQGRAWMTHCYGIVGVARGLAPDTGNGGELYAILGQSPRQLDRNIALVGRVLDGFEHMTALSRGTGALGFYEKPEQRVGIKRVSLAADLPVEARPAYEWLRPESASFGQWLQLRANRHDDFYQRPAGAVDLCNALPPVRPVKACPERRRRGLRSWVCSVGVRKRQVGYRNRRVRPRRCRRGSAFMRSATCMAASILLLDLIMPDIEADNAGREPTEVLCRACWAT